MACHRPSEGHHSALVETAPFRSEVERIEIEFAFFLPLQENANTVRVECAFDSHHDCVDESVKLLVGDPVTGQFQQ